MGRRTDRMESKGRGKSKSKKKSRKGLIITLATVLVLAGVGVGGFFLLNGQDNTPVAVNNTEPVEPVETTPPAEVTSIPKEEMELPILMYHLVEEEAVGPNEGLFLRPSEFEEEMAYLAENGYTPVTMSEVAAYFNGTGTLPKKPIALCFDDGTASVYANAFPIMEKYGFKSTQYVIADFVDTGGYMSSDQVKEMADAGHEIGSHSSSHPDLPSQDGAGLTYEITDSKTAIENISGKPVVSFCYPAGKYSDEVINTVSSSGYTSAVTTEYDFARLNQGLYTLSRIRIARGDGRDSFQSKLALYEEFINAHQ